jgi:large subunit ribosomal protein L3
MLDTIFATKRGMSQVWTNTGKRKPVTKCYVDDNIVIGKQECIAVNRKTKDLQKQPCLIFEIGYGKKKLKNTPKPLKEKIKKSGFSFGIKQVRGIKIFDTDKAEELSPEIGSSLNLSDTFEVGDVVKVTGTTKGKGFAGVVKKFKFKGGPRTHGQRDRERAPGSIGAMTDPGRVWKGKKMPGRLGGDQRTVKNLVVLHIDPEKNELWLSGPIPGHQNSIIRIVKTGKKKEIVLDKKASGIEEKKVKQEKKQTKAGQKNKKEEKNTKSKSKKEEESEKQAKSKDKDEKKAEQTENKPKKESKEDQKKEKEDKEE